MIGQSSRENALLQKLLQSDGVKLNAITTMYYVSPCCAVALSAPFAALELPRLLAAPPTVHPALLGANAACAFALNVAIYVLIGETSALTMNVAGAWLLCRYELWFICAVE
jgi:hypothetical protein